MNPSSPTHPMPCGNGSLAEGCWCRYVYSRTKPPITMPVRNTRNSPEKTYVTPGLHPFELDRLPAQ